MKEEWLQDDSSDSERTDREIPTAQRKVSPLYGQTQDSGRESEVAEYSALFGEIAHRAVMGTAKKEDRKPLLDERLEYEGYGGTASVCRVRVYDPTPAGQAAKRPLVVVFTELDDNPGTAITNCIEHLVNRMLEGLGKPEPVPVFVEHYPNMTGATGNRPQCDRAKGLLDAESFAFVGCRCDESGTVRTTNWQQTTRQTVEVIIGQRIGE